MVFASLFTLLDDITSVLDDVAMMTKVAAKKTIGVVGDDLALNADQVTGVKADRELPIVWAVAKGSLVNKAILVPISLLLSVFAPWLIKPLLVIGGSFLCFEGVEKLLHKFLNHQVQPEENQHAISDEIIDENSKIKGAIRTDFVLSAEIIIIALGTVSGYKILIQSIVMVLVGIGMTFFVYGIVGGIVKMDDFGMWLMRRPAASSRAIGRRIIAFVPWFMRALTVIGTLAMFLVGGGIIAHNLGFVHDYLHHMHWDSGLIGILANLAVGLIAGAIVCAVVLPVMKILSKRKNN